jgi:hypothetical protein
MEQTYKDSHEFQVLQENVAANILLISSEDVNSHAGNSGERIKLSEETESGIERYPCSISRSSHLFSELNAS